jgi:hypothetical protein
MHGVALISRPVSVRAPGVVAIIGFSIFCPRSLDINRRGVMLEGR